MTDGVVLLAKVIGSAVFIGGVTLAGRRWGPGFSGRLIGAPVNSAPIALSHGVSVAAAAATGTMAGAISQVAFALAFCAAGCRYSWPVAVLSGRLAFGVSRAALAQLLWLPVPLLLALVTTVVVSGVAMLGTVPPASVSKSRRDCRDIPARMAIATAFIPGVHISKVSWVGPGLAGLLTPFPADWSGCRNFRPPLSRPVSNSPVLAGLKFPSSSRSQIPQLRTESE